MKRIFTVFAVLLTMVLAGTGIADTGDSPMVGKWVAVSFMGQDVPEGTVWLENRSDGTGTVHNGEETSDYTWFHDEETGTCSVSGDGGNGEEQTFNITIVGDTCTSTDIQTGDVVMVMKRMPE